MDVQERITFCHKLICSNYSLSLWSYDANFKLLHTTTTWDILSVSDFIPAIQSHLATGSFSPLILETNVGMLWIIGFDHTSRKLNSVHFLGPALTGKDASYLLLEKLETYKLSVRTHAIVSRIISQTPAIPVSTLFNYAVMLHYALNEEYLPLSAVDFFMQDENSTSLPPKPGSNMHDGVWMEEQRLCQMFEEGNPEAVSAIISALSITSGVNTKTKDSTRIHKNNTLVLLTLCSRSCIRGGLHPSIAYDLNDHYATLLEECKTLSELVKLCKDMISDFMTCMQRLKTTPSISPPIQNVCYYIQKNLAEPLSMDSLAKLAGYSEYYFSYKFQQETGITVKEFILNERISQAKLLLTNSSRSVQEISDTLGFCNRSYFSTCFQKKEGISPTQYKAQHAKI